MAEHMSRLAALLASAGLALLPADAPAQQAFSDPTRPPSHLIDPSKGGMVQGEVSSNPLQSIIRSGKTRKALINGELVRTGGKVGTATVERIEDDRVVLRQEDGSQETLKLHPEVGISRSRTKQRTPVAGPGAGQR